MGSVHFGCFLGKNQPPEHLNGEKSLNRKREPPSGAFEMDFTYMQQLPIDDYFRIFCLAGHLTKTDMTGNQNIPNNNNNSTAYQIRNGDQENT